MSFRIAALFVCRLAFVTSTSAVFRDVTDRCRRRMTGPRYCLLRVVVTQHFSFCASATNIPHPVILPMLSMSRWMSCLTPLLHVHMPPQASFSGPTVSASYFCLHTTYIPQQGPASIHNCIHFVLN
eukprot:6192488-Pleurochrysis_carterae.AAC.1